MSKLFLSQAEYKALINKSVVADKWTYAQGICVEAIEAFPNEAEFKYLNGSILAHQKEFGEAKKWLETALLERCESIFPASFQLGLIYLTSQEVIEAKKAWIHLDALDEGHYFNQFRFGMLHLVDNRFDEALDSLRRGIDLNGEFPSINSDMTQVLNRIQSVLKQGRYGSLS